MRDNDGSLLSRSTNEGEGKIVIPELFFVIIMKLKFIKIRNLVKPFHTSSKSCSTTGVGFFNTDLAPVESHYPFWSSLCQITF